MYNDVSINNITCKIITINVCSSCGITIDDYSNQIGLIYSKEDQAELEDKIFFNHGYCKSCLKKEYEKNGLAQKKSRVIHFYGYKRNKIKARRVTFFFFYYYIYQKIASLFSPGKKLNRDTFDHSSLSDHLTTPECIPASLCNDCPFLDFSVNSF